MSISCIRCSGSSLACAAFGCDRAGEVNQVCIGAVRGFTIVGCCLGVASAEAGGRLDLGVSGMGGHGLWVHLRSRRACTWEYRIMAARDACWGIFHPRRFRIFFVRGRASQVGRHPLQPRTALPPPSENPLPPHWSASMVGNLRQPSCVTIPVQTKTLHGLRHCALVYYPTGLNQGCLPPYFCPG